MSIITATTTTGQRVTLDGPGTATGDGWVQATTRDGQTVWVEQALIVHHPNSQDHEGETP